VEDHNRVMPVPDCSEERRTSMFVSVVDVGICVVHRQKPLGCEHIATGSDFKQLGSVVVLFSSISTSTI
jgi:hypothetical protein